MTGFCERPEGLRFLARGMPWGPLFAERRNFEYGYFTSEHHFVAKYLKKPSSVLVFGSGNGREARPIAADGHWIVCFDIGFLYAKGGSMLCAREGLGNIHFLQADMYSLPFAIDTFDFIFFSIYPTAGKRRFEVLHQVREILRPGGMVMVMIPTPLYRRHIPNLPPDFVTLTEEEVAEEIVRIEECRFRFRESSVDPVTNRQRSAVFEAC
jgi:SAM-dependent methyltransferase